MTRHSWEERPRDLGSGKPSLWNVERERAVCRKCGTLAVRFYRNLQGTSTYTVWHLPDGTTRSAMLGDRTPVCLNSPDPASLP